MSHQSQYGTKTLKPLIFGQRGEAPLPKNQGFQEGFCFLSCTEGSESQVIGSGTPCEIRQGGEIIERLPNIPTHLGLSFQAEQDLIRLPNPDNLSKCYSLISQSLRALQQHPPQAQIVADSLAAPKPCL
jgi:hypothetical protein